MKPLFSFSNSKKKTEQKPEITAVPVSRALTHSLAFNLQYLQDTIGQSSDIVFRRVNETGIKPEIALIYISGLVNQNSLNQDILLALAEHPALKEQDLSPEMMLTKIKDEVIAIGEVSECKTFEVLQANLFEGQTVILIDGSNQAFSADTAGWEKRSINEPSSQGVIRGPKESFNEDLRTGTSLIRRRIKSSDLRIEEYKIGQRTHTNIALVYIKGIASNDVLDQIRHRLNAINTDAILESNYIEELIQDKSLTPFPTIQNTERPDALAGGILEGQVGILVDGTPFALLAPATFFSFFQSSEDYYQRFDISSFLRLIRFTSFFVSMMLPALYIAITTFHQEMLPTTLLVSLAAQREGVPFPALIEALMMELTFDVLREAGVRMPRAIGPAISIVGALVLGQAAVQAGLVSAAMVIVVSFTAICNLVIPAQVMANSIRLIRFLMMLVSGVLGLFGMMSFLVFLLIHMAGLRSVGVPYLSPIAPLTLRYWKDIFIRVPHSMMKIRPGITAAEEARRQSTADNKHSNSSHSHKQPER